jgi:hypothetical protein
MAQLPVYKSQEEQALMTRLWSPQLANDPEAFVLFVFPWGNPIRPWPSSKGRANGNA